MARYLIINNNNTRTKLALATTEAVLEVRANLETRDLTADSILEAVSDWEFERVVLASVVPESAERIRAAFPDLLQVSHAVNLGIDLDFPDPSTIGADRLANAVAMVALLPTVPAVAVDFGTAVTFDIVSAERAYVGGIIAPGLAMMTDYLHDRTALLPKIDITEPGRLIGKSTREAMLSGAVHGYRGLIREILQDLKTELSPQGEPLSVVATGGYADLISERIDLIGEVLPDLTLDGIRVIANLNLNS